MRPPVYNVDPSGLGAVPFAKKRLAQVEARRVDTGCPFLSARVTGNDPTAFIEASSSIHRIRATSSAGRASLYALPAGLLSATPATDDLDRGAVLSDGAQYSATPVAVDGLIGGLKVTRAAPETLRLRPPRGASGWARAKRYLSRVYSSKHKSIAPLLAVLSSRDLELYSYALVIRGLSNPVHGKIVFSEFSYDRYAPDEAGASPDGYVDTEATGYVSAFALADLSTVASVVYDEERGDFRLFVPLLSHGGITLLSPYTNGFSVRSPYAAVWLRDIFVSRDRYPAFANAPVVLGELVDTTATLFEALDAELGVATVEPVGASPTNVYGRIRAALVDYVENKAVVLELDSVDGEVVQAVELAEWQARSAGYTYSEATYIGTGTPGGGAYLDHRLDGLWPSTRLEIYGRYGSTLGLILEQDVTQTSKHLIEGNIVRFTCSTPLGNESTSTNGTETTTRHYGSIRGPVAGGTDTSVVLWDKPFFACDARAYGGYGVAVSDVPYVGVAAVTAGVGYSAYPPIGSAVSSGVLACGGTSVNWEFTESTAVGYTYEVPEERATEFDPYSFRNTEAIAVLWPGYTPNDGMCGVFLGNVLPEDVAEWNITRELLVHIDRSTEAGETEYQALLASQLALLEVVLNNGIPLELIAEFCAPGVPYYVFSDV